VGGFGSAGQSCIAVQRVFVHENIYDEFKKMLVENTKKVKTGDPFDEETVVSAMITRSDAEEKEEWIGEAVKEGADVLTGGKREEAVLMPTVLDNTTPGMKVNYDEVFAPIITLSKFNDFKKAVGEVNDSKFGLQAGVFTKNIDNAFYAYNNIEAGGVIINDVPTYRMDTMPYGGVKDSGNTREGIKYAIEEMTERKVMVVSM
jgi:acyl-CoA reductase-like NAD-dependent aldehyde dehydrogenase